MLEPACFTVSEQIHNIVRRIPARNDHEVDDGGVHQRLNRVIDHRMIIDGQQLLVCYVRQRPQTRAQSAGKYDAFHLVSSGEVVSCQWSVGSGSLIKWLDMRNPESSISIY